MPVAMRLTAATLILASAACGSTEPSSPYVAFGVPAWNLTGDTVTFTIQNTSGVRLVVPLCSAVLERVLGSGDVQVAARVTSGCELAFPAPDSVLSRGSSATYQVTATEALSGCGYRVALTAAADLGTPFHKQHTSDLAFFPWHGDTVCAPG